MFSTKLLSSLVKVFPDQELLEPAISQASMLANEHYSFQLAYFSPSQVWEDVSLEVDSPLSKHLRVYTVDLIPVELPIRFPHDNNLLRTQPGLYPDLLKPLQGSERIPVLPKQWRCLWLTIEEPEQFGGSSLPIKLTLKGKSGRVFGEEELQIEILDLKLPEQTLIHTEWFHSDCLASYYRVDVFSEAYWSYVETFMSYAVKYGVNMILTPLFTPPLDTLIGGERPTVQLVDVEKSNANYKFGFERLKRWIDLAKSVGIRYFEFSHLFTQWGAAHAPKIVATVEGKEKRIFGWSTDATGPEYQDFLDQFLPQLVRFIQEQGLEKQVYFHISDEPGLDSLETYTKASAVLHKHLKDFPIMDALSNFEFYQTGAVKNPIPATNCLEPFLENNVPDLWTYYCSAQDQEVSQRFFAQPSARNRILGFQLYKFAIAGFLHWGFNFYYSQYSRYALDPFRETDGGWWVPAGDTFMVYPGPDGPWPSLRLKVFHEGLQDLRALQLLEGFIGKEQVMKLLEDDLAEPLTFKRYPWSADWLLRKRDRVNKALKAQI